MRAAQINHVREALGILYTMHNIVSRGNLKLISYSLTLYMLSRMP